MARPTNGAPARLPRTLGLWSSVGIVVGITIGSGIFRSPAGIAQLVLIRASALGGIAVAFGDYFLRTVGVTR